MKILKVIICKAGKGVSASLPEVDGYVIARRTVEELKKDLPEGLKFHIEGLYEEEKRPWMSGEFDFEYIYSDIPAFVEACNGLISQSGLARISGINESLMRQYVSGIKKATPRTLQRVQEGLQNYSDTLRSVQFMQFGNIN
jgi:predicted RNase H-like HicB family nuclease